MVGNDSRAKKRNDLLWCRLVCGLRTTHHRLQLRRPDLDRHCWRYSGRRVFFSHLLFRCARTLLNKCVEMALQDAAPGADDDKVQLPRIHPVVHRRSSDPEHFSDLIDAVKPLVHRVPPAVVCQLWRRIRQLTVPVNCSYCLLIESVRSCAPILVSEHTLASSLRQRIGSTQEVSERRAAPGSYRGCASLRRMWL